MNNQKLIIYDFDELFNILNEIKFYFRYDLLNINAQNLQSINFENFDNYLVITKKKSNNFSHQLIINNLPLKVEKILEIININFLKKKFNQQSEIKIGDYKINLNSRILSKNNKKINLTEKEAEVIVFLKNSKEPVNVDKLQEIVWGHKNKLETHTVETHIYRLRKKINDVFDNDNFIISLKSGYIINWKRKTL